MRPLFAIAPLALALILFGPTGQAPQDAAPQSLAQSFARWMSGEPSPTAAAATAPATAASAALASITAPAAR